MTALKSLTVLLPLALAGCWLVPVTNGPPDAGAPVDVTPGDFPHFSQAPALHFAAPLGASAALDGQLDETLRPEILLDVLDAKGQPLKHVVTLDRAGRLGARVRVTNEGDPVETTPVPDPTPPNDRMRLFEAPIARALLASGTEYRVTVQARARLGAAPVVFGFVDLLVLADGRQIIRSDTRAPVTLEGDVLPVRFFVRVLDQDLDGVRDEFDRCPSVFDPDQLDDDGDGLGDACGPGLARAVLASPTVWLSDGGKARVEYVLGGAPDATLTASWSWGDAPPEATAKGLGQSTQVAEHVFQKTGTWPVQVKVCVGEVCRTDRIGDVLVVKTLQEDQLLDLAVDEAPVREARARQLAVAALTAERDERRLGSALNLVARRVVTDAKEDGGRTHVRVQQLAGGVPVIGGDVVVHLHPNGTVDGLSGALQEGLNIPLTPSIPAQSALQLARAKETCRECETRLPSTQLVVWPTATGPRLAWRVSLATEGAKGEGAKGPALPVRFVDAEDGRILFEFDNLQTGKGPTHYSGLVEVSTDQVGPFEWSLQDLERRFTVLDLGLTVANVQRYSDADDEWVAPEQKPGLDAAWGFTEVLRYYRERHGRLGIDGAMGPRPVTAVNSPDMLFGISVRRGPIFNNAAWDGQGIIAGNGDGQTFGPLVPLDVIGHEATHGVVQYTAGLLYADEPGALNESFADVFGVLAEQHSLQGAQPARHWSIGEQCYQPLAGGVPLRRLDVPHTGLNPDFNQPNQQPDHYLERYQNPWWDNGGVHINSGIPNHAFYLLAQGGTHHSGASMTGIGVAKAEKIWFKALDQYITPTSTFLDARNATIDAASALYGNYGPEFVGVQNAWGLVGVGSSPATPPQADPIPNGGFEGEDASPWVLTGGAVHTANGPYAHGGTGYITLWSSTAATRSAWVPFQLATTASIAQLSFFMHVYSQLQTSTQHSRLYVQLLSADGTVVLKTFAIYSNLNAAGPGGYQYRGAFDLAPYRGGSFRLRFLATFTGMTSATFRIDDVSLVGLGLVGNQPTCGYPGLPPCQASPGP